MKRLKLLATAGILLIIGVATIHYFIKSVLSVSQRTLQIRFQASEGTEEDPLARKRYEWFRLRDPALNEIPKSIGISELNFVKKLAKTTNSNNHAVTGEWIARGPYNIGGRSKALALDVKDENTLFAGGVSGGMWKSTDGGQSWRKTTDQDR